MLSVLPSSSFAVFLFFDLFVFKFSVLSLHDALPILFTVNGPEVVSKVVLPVAVVFLNVPLLLKVAAPASFLSSPSPCASRTPELLNTAELLRLICPVPLHTPLVLCWLNVRASSTGLPLIVSVAAGATVVVPAPLIVPPDQVKPLSTVSVAPPLSVPPLASARLSALIAAATVITPPATLNSPAPEMSEPALKLCVPPTKFSTAPAPSVYTPVPVPLLARFSVLPAATFTVPVLLKLFSFKASVPVCTSSVPLLFTVSPLAV